MGIEVESAANAGRGCQSEGALISARLSMKRPAKAYAFFSPASLASIPLGLTAAATSRLTYNRERLYTPMVGREASSAGEQLEPRPMPEVEPHGGHQVKPVASHVFSCHHEANHSPRHATHFSPGSIFGHRKKLRRHDAVAQVARKRPRCNPSWP